MARLGNVGRGLNTVLKVGPKFNALKLAATVDGAVAVTRIGQAGLAYVKGENGRTAAYLGEAAISILGLTMTRRTPARSFSIAGVRPNVAKWKVNANGLTRTTEDLADLAARNGLIIPPDVRFDILEVEIADTYFDLRVGIEELFEGKEVTTAIISRLEDRGGWVYFNDLYRNGKIPVAINPRMANSDEALLAVMAHEVWELEAHRHAFNIGGGRLRYETYEGAADALKVGEGSNLHTQAWDFADEFLESLRESGGVQ